MNSKSSWRASAASEARSKASSGALDGEAGCEQVVHLIAGVVEDHVRTHLVDAEKHLNALNAEAAEQLFDVVRTYLK